MKVSEYIAEWIASISPRVYAVCGAGAMHLNDAICHHPGIEVMAMHHEQAAAFAAEADARVSGKPGIVMVTAGPGGSNAMTGVASAYVDSIPVIVIAGQVTSSTMTRRGVRQLGLNELPMKNMAATVTKYSATIMKVEFVKRDLENAYWQAMSERKGPVWLEIPLDVQNAEIDEGPPKIQATEPPPAPKQFVETCFDELVAAQRPLLIIGNGARGADLDGLLRRLRIPVVSSWNGSDLLDNAHPLYIGRMGIFGDRASNYAVQHADLILALGTRLSVAQIGHHHALFAASAKKIVVDIDGAELRKPTVDPHKAVWADAGRFCEALLAAAEKKFPGYGDDILLSRVTWTHRLQEIKRDRPTMLPAYRKSEQGVNAYYFVERLNTWMQEDAVVVTDVGIAFIATMQTLGLNGRQRLFHSSGVSAMGYGLPAAIGAWRAGKGRQTVCLAGDGGMTVNLQELQTIAHNRIPLAIFVFANNGYATIRMAQQNHFGRISIAGPETGLSCPDFAELGKAFGIPTWSMFTHEDVDQWMGYVMTREHPILCVVHLSPDQIIAPRLQSRLENGKFVPVALDDMWPPLHEVASVEN